MHKRFTCGLTLSCLSLLPTGYACSQGFFEDSKASLNLRNFYINQDVRNEDRGGVEEWGQAFVLDYKSGFTEGPVGFGLDLLGQYALRLDAGGDADKPISEVDRRPGSVFPLESNGKARRDFSRLGVTAKLRFSKTVAHVGTLLPKLPVVSYSDGRLLPQTFEGAQVTSNEIKDLTLIAGKLEHSTDRNSSNSDSLSISGANSGSKAQFSNEFYYGGADYKVNKDLLLQYYYGNLRDFYKQHFLGLVHNWALPVGSLKTDLRYFDSDSDGENSSASGRTEGYVSSGYWGTGSSSQGEVDNRLWSALFTYSLDGHALSLGYQKITGNSDFPHINQGNGRVPYLITNAQMGKFTSAGENTWVAGYAYDFTKAGIPGLKASLMYYSGDDIDAAGSDRREWERDMRIDYTVQSGLFKGVGLTWRNAMWRGNDVGQRDQDENRLIVNYSIPLL
ncbi:OprD family porin [Azotobacter sp. CWF10]